MPIVSLRPFSIPILRNARDFASSIREGTIHLKASNDSFLQTTKNILIQKVESNQNNKIRFAAYSIPSLSFHL